MKVVVAASAGVIALLAVGTAGAADQPKKAAKPVYKAEPAPIVALPNWTGFYFGGNIGSSVGRHPSTMTPLSGGPSGPPLYDGARDVMLAPHGWNGGVQAGYNWQFAPQWLVGIEADIQFSAAKDSTSCVLPCGTPIASVPGIVGRIFPVTFSENSVNTELNWFGTVRGRLGYVAGPTLFYATGGLAYGEVKSESRVSGSTNILGAIPFNTFAGSLDASNVKTGWTAGWGIETQLGGNWSVKKEYLYIDLGTVSNSFNTVFAGGGVAANRTFSSDIRHHIFRTGLNYKFGGPDAPIAPYNWTGFYAGINGGYSVGTHETDVTAVSGAGSAGIVPVGTTLYGGTHEFMLAPDGWNGGGQIGYNWHVTPQWVVGIEADLQAASAKDRINCFLPCNTAIAIINGSILAGVFPVVFSEVSAESKLDWFGTVRARVGRAAGPALLYFTGGLAYGEVSSRGRVAGRTSILGLATVNTFAGSFDSSETKIGWTLGTGLEAQLAGNWSLKTEYLYVDLGDVSNTFDTIHLTSTTGTTGLVGATRTITTEIKEHIFRAGLNYKFGDYGKGPVVTKY